MREEQTVSGIILYTTLVGEYDKRLVILTKERGKITVFANGARRPGSTFRAASQSYVMGTFTVVPRRDSYTLVKAQVDEYFSELALDMEKMCYASYFCEMMSYYVREGDACTNHLNLLYVTFRALLAGYVPFVQIRRVYELRLMDLEGQGLHAFSCVHCGSEPVTHFDAKQGGMLCADCAKKLDIQKRVSETVVYTLQYILSAPVGTLYGFTLSDEALGELDRVSERFVGRYVDKNFKSLEILSSLS